MAARRTSAEVLAVNLSEEMIGIINEVAQEVPELRIFPASPVSKTTYGTMVRTADPTAGFRAINAGRDRNRGTLVRREVACMFLDSSWDIDIAAVTGCDWGDLTADEQRASIRAAMKSMARQIYYGTDADAEGFAGLASILAHKDDPMVVDAAGTTPATGSSVYAVKFGTDKVCLAWGNEGAMHVGSIIEQQLYDAEGKPFMGKAQDIHAWAGLQITNHKAMGRICNLTEDAGKGMTDALAAKLLRQFREANDVDPDALLISHRSHEQWKNSRTATSATGSDAPYPTEYEGVKVVPTNSISNTEPLLVAAS
jgi:hypothetical protein